MSLMSAIRSRGGLKKTLEKAIQLCRRDGLAGIRRGFGMLTQLGGNDYAKWIRHYDTLTHSARSAMLARINGFPYPPMISVVVAYHANPEWLRATIDSLRKQIYPHWELCVAENATAAQSANSVIEGAKGEWIAFLKPDDFLSEHALFWVAEAIHKNPDVRLMYSDEDKIDRNGKRSAPDFKCGWNPDLFYSCNMISHLAVYRKDLLQVAGGFRAGFDGAEDYDLALRCIETITSEQIHHIPRVLYHQRITDDKSGAAQVGEKTLNEHFQRKSIHARAEITDCGYRVRYVLPATLPLVSLMIPTRNRLELIARCVETILTKTTYPNYEILIVDNGSDDPAVLQYFRDLQSESKVRVICDDGPFNYSALNNNAAHLARGEVLGLLNNDLEVITPEWLSEMVSIALQPGVGAVGARLWYPNDTLQHGGVILGINGCAGHAHKHLPRSDRTTARANLMQSFSAVTAACLIIRKEIYDAVGGLNEADLAVAFNDVDFCLRVREAGYRNVWTPYAELYHHEHASRGYEDTQEKLVGLTRERTYMQQRWGASLLHDPAYSPNLTLAREDFSFAWPPRLEEFDWQR